MRSFGVRVFAAACLVLVSAQLRADKKITREQLPDVVRKTADEQAQGATVRGYSMEMEAGRREYEVLLTVNGHGKDVSIEADGKLLEVEEEVSLDALSEPVRNGLLGKAGPGKITKVESLTKHGTLVAYEAQVLKGTAHSEIQVGPDGKSLSHSE